jgi:putative transcriptional regulator
VQAVDLGQKLRQYREERGITQRMLADAIGCTQGAVGLWEGGHKVPSIRNRLLIAEVLGLRPADIMPEFAPGTDNRAILVTEPDLIELVRFFRSLPEQDRPTLLSGAKAWWEAKTEHRADQPSIADQSTIADRSTTADQSPTIAAG